MANHGKKVEVHFGAFGCTIEGYDNPVEQLHEVMGLMQQMIADTPALAELPHDFDPKPIEQALMGNAEGTGIIVIRNDNAEPMVEPTADLAEEVGETEETDATALAAIEAGDNVPSEDAGATAEDDSDAAIEDADEPLSAQENVDEDADDAAALAEDQTPGDPASEDAEESDDQPELAATAEDTEGDMPWTEAPNLTAMLAKAEVAAQDADESEANDTDGSTDNEDDASSQAEREAMTAMASFAALRASQMRAQDEAAAAEDAAVADEPSDLAGAALPFEVKSGETDEGAPEDSSEPAAAETETSEGLEVEATAEEEIETAQADTPDDATEAEAGDDRTPNRAPINTPANIFAAPAASAAKPDMPAPNIFGAPPAAAAAVATAAATAPFASMFASPQPADQEEDTTDPDDLAEMDAGALDAADSEEHEEEGDLEDAAPLTSVFEAPSGPGKVLDLGASDAVSEPAESEPEAPSEDEPSAPVTSIFGTPDVAETPQAPEAETSEPEVSDLAAPEEEPASPAETDPVAQVDPSPEEADPVEPVEPQDAGDAGSKSLFGSLLSRITGTSDKEETQDQEQASAASDAEPAPSEATSDAEPAPSEAPSDDDASSDTLDAAAMATRANAETVADQLAAAAGWLTVVKGQPQFSRRDVMTVLETIPTDQPRELADRIKGFGKLVRSGDLVLVDDGVFTMSRERVEQFQGLADQG